MVSNVLSLFIKHCTIHKFKTKGHIKMIYGFLSGVYFFILALDKSYHKLHKLVVTS